MRRNPSLLFLLVSHYLSKFTPPYTIFQMASFMASPNAGSATGDFMEIEISIHCRDLQKVRQSPAVC
jgi:hypothetical protein